jgi:hypothetical protein
MRQLCTDPKILGLAKQYNWRTLQFLGELHPVKEMRIKGVNRNNGDNIRIRLRDKSKPDEFRDIDDIKETWLHELTHNRVSGHLSNFDKFRKVLEDAYYGANDSTTFKAGVKQGNSSTSKISSVSNSGSNNGNNIQ